jgi:YD repeat-containing protein
MRRIIPALAAIAVVTAGAAVAQRKFGPEWTRVKTPHGEMYHRTLVSTVSHWPGGNVSSYRLPLESGEVTVNQDDEHRLTSVRLPDGSEFEATVDKNGKPTGRRLIMGDAVYFDLDGNGTIDALYEPRGGGDRRPFIVFEGRYVEVEDHKNAFDGRRKWAPGRNVEYVFEGGRWRKS